METAHWILVLKTLHVVGFTAWFAGMFYLVRMFIYDVEAGDRPEVEKTLLQTQFRLMQQRVYKIIMNPAMMITWTGGLGMLALNPSYFAGGWMHLKLTLIVLLTVYHLYSKGIMKRLASNTNKLGSRALRLFNEVATLLLVAISIVAVFGKANQMNLAYVGIAVVLVAGLLMAGIGYYRKVQKQNPNA